MRVEIARGWPSRQILSTWGTKATVEKQPAIMPTAVGSQVCMSLPECGSVAGPGRPQSGVKAGDAPADDPAQRGDGVAAPLGGDEREPAHAILARKKRRPS